MHNCNWNLFDYILNSYFVDKSLLNGLIENTCFEISFHVNKYDIISFINSYFKGHFCTSMKLFAHANSLFETDTRTRENLFLPDFFLFLFAGFNKTPLPYETCYTLVIYMLIKRSYFVVSQSFLWVQLNIVEFRRPTTHDFIFCFVISQFT